MVFDQKKLILRTEPRTCKIVNALFPELFEKK